MKYIISESQLRSIIDNTINEQSSDQQRYRGLTDDEIATTKSIENAYRSRNRQNLAAAIGFIKSREEFVKINNQFLNSGINGEKIAIDAMINKVYRSPKRDYPIVKGIIDGLMSKGVKFRYTSLSHQTGARDFNTGQVNTTHMFNGKMQIDPNTTVPTQSGGNQQPQQSEERQLNITRTYCSVNAQGVITTGSWKNRSWEEYVKQFKLTNKEIQLAKDYCSKRQQNKDKTSQFTGNESFPLKYMQKGEKIRRMQRHIGVSPTGNFYSQTDKRIAEIAKSLNLSYVRQNGVGEALYNKIMQTNFGNKKKPIQDKETPTQPTQADLEDPTPISTNYRPDIIQNNPLDMSNIGIKRDQKTMG